MEKTIGEEDIKELEQEIDSAVDRLFVERAKESTESLLTKSPALDTASEIDRIFELEVPETAPAFAAPPVFSPPPPSSGPPSMGKSIEKLETQLLSLEWEITKENLRKTREEIPPLRGSFRGRSDILSILDLMEKLLNRMIEKEENIRPPFIKFLLDCKETIKLLMRHEADQEIKIYQQLVYAGIEARFACLEGLRQIDMRKVPSMPLQEVEKVHRPKAESKGVEEVVGKMDLFLERLETLVTRVGQPSSIPGMPSEGPGATKPINITIFRVDEKLFGVESEKVFKLFKLPQTFHAKVSDRERIRLRDLVVRVIDLKKILSTGRGDRKGEIRILTVKDNGDYKGLMVDQVVKQLSANSEMGSEYGKYFMGMVDWIYQEHPVRIPILDVKKF
jgi:hypothetical protein